MKHLTRPTMLLIGILFLTACTTGIFTATTTTTTYTHEGKTYQVQHFDDGKTSNVTMFEMVNGERQFAGFYTVGETRADEEVNRRNIRNVIDNGEEIGEREKKSQPSIDFNVLDFGGE